VDSHSLSTTRDVLSLVNGHDGITLAVDRDQTLVPGIAGRLVRDGTVGRVVPLPEVKVVEKGVSLLLDQNLRVS